jgi:hypothetical protein
MKTHGVVKVYLYALLTSPLYRGDSLASRPCCFTFETELEGPKRRENSCLSRKTLEENAPFEDIGIEGI